MPRKARSRAQARFFGAVAGGQVKRKGLSKAKAREMLKGTRHKNLPPRKKRKR